MHNNNIRPALDTERAEIIRIWERSVRATHDFLREEDITLYRGEIAKALPHITHLHVYPDDQDRPCGFSAVEEGCLEMLFIDPDHRGTGIGSRLLEHAINKLGVTRVDVNEQNTGAYGFYLSKGFHVVSRSELDPYGKPYPILSLKK